MTPPSPPPREWGRTQRLWRGAARGWPALQRWTFAHLGALDPQRAVQVAQGNRETNVDALAQRLDAQGLAAPLVVDLDPGDALYVPHGWWHEV